jgi:hypothetical protein
VRAGIGGDEGTAKKKSPTGHKRESRVKTALRWRCAARAVAHFAAAHPRLAKEGSRELVTAGS